jgi:uncharacterized phosphosugar-binding protein
MKVHEVVREVAAAAQEAGAKAIELTETDAEAAEKMTLRAEALTIASKMLWEITTIVAREKAKEGDESKE